MASGCSGRLTSTSLRHVKSSSRLPRRMEGPLLLPNTTQKLPRGRFFCRCSSILPHRATEPLLCRLCGASNAFTCKGIAAYPSCVNTGKASALSPCASNEPRPRTARRAAVTRAAARLKTQRERPLCCHGFRLKKCSTNSSWKKYQIVIFLYFKKESNLQVKMKKGWSWVN